MNVAAIIAEYNPLHNGHKYHIAKTKKETNADFVIIIMSGSFTQQGNIAILNKFDRANTAIENGADLVIELPTIYATSSSENFAKGAINILHNLGVVTHISFGIESSDHQLLNSIVNKIALHEAYINNKTAKIMKDGISAPVARDKCAKEILNKAEYLEFSKPNNILAIEYLKTLSHLKSNIQPVFIKRKSASHNEQSICATNDFTSSTSIRNEIQNNNNYLDTIKDFIPPTCLKLLSSNKPKLNENIWSILKYEVLRLNKVGLKNIKEVNEGLENRLYKMAFCSNSYDEYIFNVKTKRYTLGKIKRICINIILGITKEKNDDLSCVKYAKILKIKKESKDLLSLIEKKSSIPIITSINPIKLKEIDDRIINSINLDILATNISEIYSNNLNIDYTNYIF